MELHLLISVSAAVIPALLLVWFFYSRDVNPEPRTVVLVTFILGFVIVIPVLVVAVPMLLLVVPLLGVGDELAANLSRSAGMAFLSAAIPEEFFKWLVLMLYCVRHPAFDEPMDGVVYGVTASLGFATFENVMYVWQSEATVHAGLQVAIMRGLTAVPVHACLGAIMGYFVGQARFASNAGSKGMLYLLSLIVPIFFHGIYDLGAMALPHTLHPVNGSGPLMLLCLALVFGTLLILIVWTLIIVWRMRAAQFRQAS